MQIMTENRSTASSESLSDSLPSLNISADTSESDDNHSNDQDNNLFVNGNLQPYRFQPVHNSDSESDNDEGPIADDNDDIENRRTNTDW